MKQILIIIICLTLSSCVSRPQEVVKQNNKFEYHTSRNPESAANCIVNNSAELFLKFHGTVIKDGSKYQSIIVGPDGATTIAVFYSSISKTGGTDIQSYISNNVLGNKANLSKSFVGGCK